MVKKAHEIGNNLGIPEAAWRDSCEFLEEELKEETGADIKIPVNQEGAEVLLVPPSADLFANTDTMMGYAKLFHAAGISWTTSTYASEAGNFGLFLNYEQLKKVNRRAGGRRPANCGVKRLVIGECGHAWRAAQGVHGHTQRPAGFSGIPVPGTHLRMAARLIRENG